MSLAMEIEQQIRQAFGVTYLQLDNESHLHSGPSTESHFKLVLVSSDFEGMSKVKCHQAVYKALSVQMPKFHALALHTFAPSEWDESVEVAESPLCRGGSKK